MCNVTYTYKGQRMVCSFTTRDAAQDFVDTQALVWALPDVRVTEF